VSFDTVVEVSETYYAIESCWSTRTQLIKAFLFQRETQQGK
jgi:hypothetical protein